MNIVIRSDFLNLTHDAVIIPIDMTSALSARTIAVIGGINTMFPNVNIRNGVIDANNPIDVFGAKNNYCKMDVIMAYTIDGYEEKLLDTVQQNEYKYVCVFCNDVGAGMRAVNLIDNGRCQVDIWKCI